MNVKKKSLLACFIALALVLGVTTAFATSAKPASSDEDLTDAEISAQVSQESLPEGEAAVQDILPEGKADIPEGADMVWPVDSEQITSGFGSRTAPGGEFVVDHSGVDIGGLEAGAPIYAAGAGTVKDTGFNADNGNYVRLSHGDEMETLYAHCQSVLVKTGDAVVLGQTIATVGSTGKSTGPHLHFEVLMNGVQWDPEAYYRKDNIPAGPVGQEGNTNLPDGIINAEVVKNIKDKPLLIWLDN